MDVKIDMEGLADLERRLVALGATASKKAMRGTIMAALSPVWKAARSKVPVKSGALRKAIRRKTFITKSNKHEAEGGISMETRKKAAGWRWHFIEFGTKNQSAHPFMRPAIDENKDAMIAKFRDELGKRIDKASKK